MNSWRILASLLLTMLLRQPVNGAEQCTGLNGETYLCNGFCCVGLGCCSFSNLWYAWMLLALLLILCLCGCASCGARRYYVSKQARRGDRYHPIYYSSSSEIFTEPLGNTRRTRQKRHHYNATSNRQSVAANNGNATSNGNAANDTTNRPANGTSEEPPPYTAPSAPPPYSYY